MILSYKSYFILQELYQVELHPHPLHSSAKVARTPVDPIGYPHFLAPQSSTTTSQEPTLYNSEKDPILKVSSLFGPGNVNYQKKSLLHYQFEF